MQNVTLEMTDLLTGKKATRTIDITNAMSSGSECWELRGENDQRENLERWISERGNAQHEADLQLDSFYIS